MKKIKSIFIIILILIILYLIKTYLFLDFKSMNIDKFINRIDKSSQNTVVSWWYYWEKEWYHYFMEKWVIKRRYYKIDNNRLKINNVSNSFSIINPSNLKSKNIKYLPIIELPDEYNLDLKTKDNILK